MSVDNTNRSVNHQTSPHHEGQQNNIAPLKADGQRNSNNHGQAMSNMMQESDEQKADAARDHKDDRDVQQEEKRP